MKIVCLSLLAFFFTSCGPHFLLVKDELVTKQRLASNFVKSPDPDREQFKKGKQLIVEWMLPQEYRSAKDLTLQLHLIYGNLEEEVVEYPVKMWAGYVTHLLIDPKFTQKKGLVSYKAEIVNSQQEVIESFEQQLWVSLLKHRTLQKNPSGKTV